MKISLFIFFILFTSSQVFSEEVQSDEWVEIKRYTIDSMFDSTSDVGVVLPTLSRYPRHINFSSTCILSTIQLELHGKGKSIPYSELKNQNPYSRSFEIESSFYPNFFNSFMFSVKRSHKISESCEIKVHVTKITQ